MKSLQNQSYFLDALKYSYVFTMGVFGGFLLELVMSSMIKLDDILTMSSLEIAELTGKEHKNVMRDIRTMLGELEGALSFELTHINPQNGQSYPIFNLPKREALILVSGYSVAMRAKIIDRWQELESKVKPAFQVPATLSEALRLAADQAETIEKQTLLIEQQKPAVEFVSRYVEAKSTKAISDVAKILGVKQSVFIAWLVKRQYIFKRSGGYLPYSTYDQYFEVKTGEAHGHAYHQTKFTPAGIEWISRKWIDYSESSK